MGIFGRKRSEEPVGERLAVTRLDEAEVDAPPIRIAERKDRHIRTDLRTRTIRRSLHPTDDLLEIHRGSSSDHRRLLSIELRPSRQRVPADPTEDCAGWQELRSKIESSVRYSGVRDREERWTRTRRRHVKLVRSLKHLVRRVEAERQRRNGKDRQRGD